MDTRGLNNILGGTGLLAAILNKVRDPNKDSRDRLMALLQQRPDLIQQYKDQGNPAIANTLAGMKPRFGSSGGYDNLTSLINQAPASPDVVRNQKIRDILANANKAKALPTGSPSTNINLNAINAGVGMIKDDITQSADEFIRKGKIDSPDERTYDAQRLEQQRAATAGEKARTKIAEGEAASREEERSRIKQGRDIAAPQFNALPKGANWYEELLKGEKISSDAKTLALSVPELSKRIELDKSIYDMEQSKKAEAKSRADNRQNSYVTQLMLRGDQAGVHMSEEQATAIANTPSDKLKGSPYETILKGVNDEFQKRYLNQAKVDFIRQKNLIINKIKSEDRDPTEQDINDLNNASIESFSNLGDEYSPIAYALSTKQEPWYKANTSNIKIVGGGQKLVGEMGKDFPKDLPVATDTTKSQIPQDQLATNFETLRKKYPKESVEQLKARALKGEK